LLQIERLTRIEVDSGFPVTMKVRIREETPLRIRLRVWNWKYRQRSAGSHAHTQGATGAGGGHDHGAVETDGVDAAPGAHQTARTYPGSAVNSTLLVGVATAGQAAETIRTDSVADHTHTNPDTGAAAPPAAKAEVSLTAGFLTIQIDGKDYKTGIGTVTDGDLIVDEVVPRDKLPPGEHDIAIIATAKGAVEAVLEVEY